MCINIEVILPTVEKFLLLYPLRCGSILITFWTMLRSFFCMIFFSTAILEVLVGKASPLGAWLVKKPVYDNVYLIYYTYLLLLLGDTMLFVFTIQLAIGLHRQRPYHLKHYLACRFVTWVIELTGLFILCLADKLLIGYYLAILFFVILEFYSYVVVYSYYINMQEDRKYCNDSNY